MTPSTQTPMVREAEQKLYGVLKKYERSLKEVLPKVMTPERFVWLVVNNIRTTPGLLGCTPQSFINSVMLASNIGLEIRRNSAYLIPFGKDCTLVLDYRGKIELARRSGKVAGIVLEQVREADLFEYEETNHGTTFRHVPYLVNKAGGRIKPVSPEERGEVVLGYSVAKLVNAPDQPQIDIMTLAQVEAIRRRSKNGRSDLTLEQIRALNIDEIPYTKRVPWITDYDQMFRKTLAHRGANYWPQSSELVLSQEIDDSAETGKQPQAMGLESFVAELDPADNHPLVEIPDTSEERKAAQAAVVTAKTGIVQVPTFGTAKKPVDWPDGFDGRECWWNGKHFKFDDESGNFKEIA